MKLQLSNIAKSFGTQEVLTSASLLIKNNEKIALVGRNGCGKTTLLKIITGEEDPDRGDRFFGSGVKAGYLSQISFPDESRTVREELISVFDELIQVQKALEEQTRILETDHSQQQLDKFDRLQTRFDTLGGYDYEYEMKSVFFHFGFTEEELDRSIGEFSSGQRTRIALVKLLLQKPDILLLDEPTNHLDHFGFTEEELDRSIGEFSSGQRTRIALVKLLLQKPDILLLDEPTNHLDIDSIEWLEGYIARYPSAVVLVSHDRMFLDRVADVVVEIEFGKTTRYPGNYSHYVKAKEEWLEKNHEAYERQQQEIKRVEALIERFRYKATKAAMVQSRIKSLEKMDRIEDVKSDRSIIKASFSSARKGGERVLEVENLKVGYDSVLSSVSMELFRNDRMAIVGPNGIGKSTFVKTLMELIPSKGGSFHFGHQIDIGYFDQDSAQMKSTKSVLDELWDEHPMADQTEIRNALAGFLFTQDDVFKSVNDLSGGEKVRLALAKLMMDHDNLLILDEPTNHLDIPAKEALEKALKDYDGTLLFVSHDRMFLSKMANKVLEILDEPTNHLDIPAKEALEKALKDYDGTLLFVSHDRMFLSKMANKVLEIGETSHVWQETWPEYAEKKKNGQLHVEAESKGKSKNQPPTKTSAQIRSERNAAQNRATRLEAMMTKAEEELEALRELRFEPEYYQDYRKMEELDEQIDEKHNEIERYMKEWEEKMTFLEEVTE